MPQVCLYFQLHQPYRLADLTIFDIGKDPTYFSTDTNQGNKAIFQKVSHKSYRPMLTLLAGLLEREPQFCFALSCSGIFLEQAAEFDPEVLQLLKRVVATGRVELLAETYYHSLASLYSPTEFKAQVESHHDLIYSLFEVRPRVFRNTELIYSNDVAAQVAELGFLGMLTEAVPRYLHGRAKTQLYQSTLAPGQKRALPLLLKHAELSDDVAFRFSDRNWQWYPLTVERYLDWVTVYPEHEFVNLFMDFETFGEHQWADTGIFEFFAHFVTVFTRSPWNRFVTPSQVFSSLSPQNSQPVYDVPQPISWADVDRDLTAWIENAFQQDCLKIMYELETVVHNQNNQKVLEKWRRLQTSDHFYYMCTKWSADGDVHAYFSPYKSPYEAYRRFTIALADLQEELLEEKPLPPLLLHTAPPGNEPVSV